MDTVSAAQRNRFITPSRLLKMGLSWWNKEKEKIDLVQDEKE